MRTADAALIEQIRKVTQPVVDTWIAEASKKGVDGRQVIEALRAESRRVAEGK